MARQSLPTFEIRQGQAMPDPLGILVMAWRRRSWMLLSLAVGLVSGGLYCSLVPAVYQSEAQVLVVRKHPEAVSDDGRNLGLIGDDIAMHRLLLQSTAIVERAVRDGQLGSLRCFAGVRGDLSETVGKAISVNSLSRENAGSANGVIRIAFRGRVADECGIVVQALVNSYRAFLEETYQDAGGETVKLIEEARRVLEQDLKEKEAAYLGACQRSLGMWKGDEFVSPHQDRLAAIEGRKSALLLRKAEIQGRLNRLDAADKAGESDRALAKLVLELARKSDESTAEDRASGESLRGHLARLQEEEEGLSQLLGPQHPQLLAVRRRMESVRGLYALPSVLQLNVTAGTDEPARPTQPCELVAQYRKHLGQELQLLQTSEQALDELQRAELAAAREFDASKVDEMQKRNDLTRTQALYDGLVKRLEEAKLVAGYGGFEAHVIESARSGKKVSPNAVLTIAMSVFLGLFGGLGLVWIAESADSQRPQSLPRDGVNREVVGHGTAAQTPEK